MAVNITTLTKHNKENTNKGPYGTCLRCPSCDGFTFHMYRNNIHHDDEMGEIAHCLDCDTATYAAALKDEYHEDKGEDFDILTRVKHIITFECMMDPEPDWKYPDHPNAVCSL
jgi:hypothetical protein